jgi:hypothetical protein
MDPADIELLHIDNTESEDNEEYSEEHKEYRKALHVFKHAMENDDSDEPEDEEWIKDIFADNLEVHVKYLYTKERYIPMIDFNGHIYKVNDYQFVLRDEPEYRYVIHTNFLIENFGKDKWYRFLDDKDVAIQFYKVPITVPIDDLWIDSDHIESEKSSQDLWRNRTQCIKDFTHMLRRDGDPIGHNQCPDDDSDNSNNSYDDDRSYDDPKFDKYRRTLRFPSYPKDSIILDPYIQEYVGFNTRLNEQLKKAEPYLKVQMILCFRISNQVIGK